jgi:hypothetical protein
MLMIVYETIDLYCLSSSVYLLACLPVLYFISPPSYQNIVNLPIYRVILIYVLRTEEKLLRVDQLEEQNNIFRLVPDVGDCFLYMEPRMKCNAGQRKSQTIREEIRRRKQK